MVSFDHEGLLELFRKRPDLAPKLLGHALNAQLPEYSEARTDAADLTNIQPAEYRADLVVVLSDQKPTLGIVVEVQLSTHADKRFSWPVYVTTLRARLRCPVFLLVVAPDENVARWAAEPIDLGGGSVLKTWVLGAPVVSEVIDEEQARADPELAVLSSISYGRDADVEKAIRIAMAAQKASLSLDDERLRLYCDLILSSLSEAARREFPTMDLSKYPYRSEFARHYVAQGLEQGRAEGRAELVMRLTERRFGTLSESDRARIAAASIDELDAIGERLLTATTLHEALNGS
jgi:hypothetical protein